MASLVPAFGLSVCSLASWCLVCGFLLLGSLRTPSCLQPFCFAFKHDEGVSGKADGFGKAPLLCFRDGLTESENYALSISHAAFALSALRSLLTDLLVAAMCAVALPTWGLALTKTVVLPT